MGIFADMTTNFAITVSKGVEWVPMHSAGIPDYNDEQILRMVLLSPECKKKQIHTLYDALNLLYFSSFHDVNDTMKIDDSKNCEWEYHKTGYEFIKDNSESCSSGSAGLLYLLEGDIEESGYFCFLRPNLSGHIVAYIRCLNFYFIVDPLTYASEYKQGIVKETGKMDDFRKRRYFTNGLLRVRNLEDYVRYFRRYLLRENIKFFFYSYRRKSDFCMPIKCSVKEENYKISFPINSEIVFYEHDSEKFKITYETPPILPMNI